MKAICRIFLKNIVLPLKNLVFRLKNLVFQLKWLDFHLEIIFSIEKLSFSNIKLKNLAFRSEYQVSTKNLVLREYCVFRS